MHIFISSIGSQSRSTGEIFNKLSLVDQAYLVVDKDRKHTGEDAKKSLMGYNVPTELIIVDGSRDFNGIVDAVMQIAEKHKDEKGVQYSIDITGGTSLMSAALSYVSFLIGARAYYVMFDRTKKEQNIPQDPLSERIVCLPSANIPSLKNMGEKTRRVLDEIYECFESRGFGQENPLSESKLMDYTGMLRTTQGYHLKQLRNNGVIELRENDNNHNLKDIVLTEDGRTIKGWLWAI